MLLLLLESAESLAILAKASLDAALLFLLQTAISSEIDAEVSAELVLSHEELVGQPVLVVASERSPNHRSLDLRSPNRLEGIYLELVAGLSHL